MTNGNIETRLSALEVQMQEMRELLRETQQIVNSNAKAIQANSAANAELRGLINETRQTMNEGFQSVQSDLMLLSQTMQQFFTFQAQTNQAMQNSLEDHQMRLDLIDPLRENE